MRSPLRRRFVPALLAAPVLGTGLAGSPGCAARPAADRPAVEPSARPTLTLGALADFTPATSDPTSPAVATAPPYRDPARGAWALDASQHRGVFAAAKTVFAGPAGRYEPTLTSLTETDGESSYRLLVNGVAVGDFTNPPSDVDYAPHRHAFPPTQLAAGDRIAVAFSSASNGKVPEGNAFAWSRGRWTTLTLAPAPAGR